MKMMKEQHVTYTSFTQKYKKMEDLVGLTELNLTPNESFELKQIYDLNELAEQLKHITRIDLSNNYLSKLVLKNFSKLHKLIVKQNMINESNLLLPRLRILDLSSNLLKEIPFLGNTPELSDLDLSKNLIIKVTSNDFMPVKRTLETIKLSYNRIHFPSVNDFISFVDGIKFFQLKEISIEGNDFTKTNHILSNSYKTLLVLSLKNLIILNGEPRIIASEIINEEEIKRQMLYEEEYMNKSKKTFYSSFTQVYKNTGELEKISSLELTPLKSFLMKSVDDLVENAKHFTQLSFLNISENLLTELDIGEDNDDFPELNALKASKNNLVHVRLSYLPSLMEIDLSDNQLTSIPRLNHLTGPVRKLFLANNKIKKIDLNRIRQLTFLQELNLAGNLINFQSESGIEKLFAMDIENLTQQSNKDIQLQHNQDNEDDEDNHTNHKQKTALGSFAELVSLRVDDNPFCSNLRYMICFTKNIDESFYKTHFRINGVLVKDYLKQLEDLEEKNESAGKYLKEQETKKHRIVEIEAKFAALNDILERLISFNGNNQLLYFEFLSEINTVQDVNHQYTSSSSTLRQTFETFLMNCNELISLNTNFEVQILRTIASFSLYPKFNLCKYTLDFLKMYVTYDDTKKALIKGIIENLIIANQQTNNPISLEMITALISFFKDTSISNNLLYKNLILNIVEYIAVNQAKCKELKGKKAKSFIDSLQFVLEYLQVLNEEDEDNTNSNNAPSASAVDVKQKQNDTSFDVDSNNSSQLSIDPEDDKTNSNFIYDVLYQDLITSIKRNDFILETSTSGKAVNLVLRQCEAYYDIFHLNEYKRDNVLGYDIFQDIANNHSLVTLQKCPASEVKNYEFLIYCYVFLNVFKCAYTFLTEVKAFFCKLRHEKEDLSLRNEKLFMIIKLINVLISTYQIKKYPFNYLLKECDVEMILDTLDNLITPVLREKKDTVSYDQLISRYIFGQTSITPDMLENISNFYHSIPILLECIGTLISFLIESKYFKKIESPILEKYILIVTSPKADPYILRGSCMLMNKVISCSFLIQNDLSMSTIFNQVKNFRNLLHFIDYNNPQYRSIVDSLRTEAKLEPGTDNPFDFNFISLESLFDFFLSIINIFVTIAKYELTQSKLAHSILEELQERRMYDILGACLKIVKNDEIRKKAIECFFYVDHKAITNEIIALIIQIVSKYTSISEGEIEYILSIIFLTLNNKLSSMIRSIDSNNFTTMKLAVNAAVKFLMQNTERYARDSELEEKNTLSASLIMFLTTASRSPLLFADIFEETDKLSSFATFKRIMINDATYFNEEYYIPIQIERTHLGCYLPVLFESIEGFNCLRPYSYPFLRILIKTADILCGCNEYAFSDIKLEAMEKLFKKLSGHVNQRFGQVVSNEILDWYSFQTNSQRSQPKLVPSLLKKVTEDTSYQFFIKDEMVDDQYQVILNSRIAELIRFDIKEFYPEQYPEMTMKEQITEHANFIISFPNILMFLLGKKANLSDENISDELAKKYYLPIVNSERILSLFEYYKANGNISTMIGEIKHFESEIPFSTPISKSVIEKLKTITIDSLLKISNLISYVTQTKSESIVNTYLSFENDLCKFNLYGLDPDATRKTKEETVNNPHIRSILISALLRCIYAVLISPSKAIRDDFIDSLFIGEKYQQLLLFANTARYYQNYNLYFIIQELFSVKNLQKLIEACTYSPIKEQSSNNKIKALNDLIFSSHHSTEKDKERKRKETEIFHQFFITATFLEKEIKLKAHQSKDNFLFIYTFEMCIHSFINTYFQLNFKVIDNYFRSAFIIKRLCLTEHYQMMFILKEQLIYQTAEAFNAMKELRLTYGRYQIDFLNNGVAEIADLANTVFEKELHISRYISNNELNKKKINELLSLLIVIDSDSQNEIFFNCLRLTEEREKLAKLIQSKQNKQQQQPNNNKKEKDSASDNGMSNNVSPNGKNQTKENNGDVQSVLEEKSPEEAEKDAEIQAQVIELMDSLISIHFKNKVLREFQKEDFIMLSSYIAMAKPIGSMTKAKKYYVVISFNRLILYPIENKANILNTNVIDISSEAIESICIYDVTRILFISFKGINLEGLKLQFSSLIFSNSFIEELRRTNSAIQVYNSNGLMRKLTTFEAKDENCKTYNGDVNDRAKEKDQYKIDNAKAFTWNKIKKLWEKTEQFRFTNSIEENFYYKHKISNKYMTNAFYLEDLEKIIVFNPYYMYIIKENLLMLNQVKISIVNEELIIGGDSLWNIEEKVVYTDIKKVSNDFLKKEIMIWYKGPDNKNQLLHMKLNEKYEMYLINHQLLKINEFARDRWNINRKMQKYAQLNQET